MSSHVILRFILEHFEILTHAIVSSRNLKVKRGEKNS